MGGGATRYNLTYKEKVSANTQTYPGLDDGLTIFVCFCKIIFLAWDSCVNREPCS